MRTNKNARNWSKVLLPLLLIFFFLPLLFTRKQQASASLVTITEFSDFQCPYCKRAASVVEQLRQTYGARVKFVFKQMPLPMHKQAFKAAQASVCAGKQGKFWEYHDRLFAASDLSVDVLNRTSAEVGLHSTAFSQCLESQASRAIVEKDMAEAERLGVNGTPTFFVDDKAVTGATTFAALKQKIDGALTEQSIPPVVLTSRSSQASTGSNSEQVNTVNAGAARASITSPKVTIPTAKEQQQAAASVAASGLTISPASINFGYQLVGESIGYQPVGESNSSDFKVTVSNPSRTSSIVISDIAVIGRDRSDFIVDSISRTPPVSICCGDSITFQVSFKPTTPWRAGTRDAKLKIQHSKGVDFVPLTGIGATCGGPPPACQFACADADGDGLNDAWEIAGGIDFNNDGLIDAAHDLLLPGADPNKPDIYVHYDYLYLPDQGTACTPTPDSPLNPGNPNFSTDCDKRQECRNNVCRGHTHAPSQTALQIVIDAFTAHDITMHIDANPRAIVEPQDSIVTIYPPDIFAANPECAGPGGVSFDTLKNTYSDPKRAPAYHYAIFAHYIHCDESPFTGTACLNDSECQAIDITLTCDNFRCSNASHCAACPVLGFTPVQGSSGIAERPGNDFVVSLGGAVDRSFPITDNMVAGAFMHELGHNLGLHHGGPNTLFDAETNYKPNYFSIMNYAYEFPGIGVSDAPGPFLTTTLDPATSYRIDYSETALSTLFENSLDETTGVSGPPTNKDVTILWTNFGTCKTYGPSNGTPIDWDAQPPVDATGNCLSGYTAPAPYTATGVSADIAPDGLLTALSGGNDWANLIYRFQCLPSLFGKGAPVGSVAAAAPLQAREAVLQDGELTFQEAFARHIIYPQRKVPITILDDSSRARASVTSSSLCPTVTVTLLGSHDFKVKDIEPSSLLFGGTAPMQTDMQDVNGDGKLDLILTFDRATLKLNPNARSAFLSGWLKNSQEIVAEGMIETAR
jgi:predicted DsbA family dithiol-disulfide isomerase